MNPFAQRCSIGLLVFQAAQAALATEAGPRLGLSRQLNLLPDLLVSWTNSGASVLLESTAQIEATNLWQPYPVAPSLYFDQFSIRPDPLAREQYFRLRSLDGTSVPPPLVIERFFYSVSWPRSEVDYVLETAGELNASTAWKLSLQPPRLVNDQYQVGVNLAGRQGFFRLRALPQDPGRLAPPVPTTTVTDFSSATAFLYSGDDAIQGGVTNGTITGQRAAVIRGGVRQRDNTPLSSVRIAILNHPELGYTFTRVDGRFDLAVNGGGPLTLKYERDGFLPAQRQVTVPWRDYVEPPEVVLVQVDPMVTPVVLGANAPLQVARGTVQTDADGSRQATVILPPGTAASLVLANGVVQPVSSLNIRATEYTVGPNGPKAMPAELPPNTAYTYCVELSADEALAVNADSVQFDRSLWFYVDNFLNFPVGGNAPYGYYDRRQGQWIASANGRIIKVLGLTNGLAELDVSGGGVAADAPTLAALGFTDGERARLATLYAAGKSLWRVPITHFSPGDLNWRRGVANNAVGPKPGNPKTGDPNQPDTSQQPGFGTLDLNNQILKESVPLVGTPFSLNYASDRVPGRAVACTLQIELYEAGFTNSSIRRIELEVYVAGRVFTQSFAPGAARFHPFEWDGLDAYGRRLQGQQPVRIRIGYVYPAIYGGVPAFGQNGSGVIVSADTTRIEYTFWAERQAFVGAFDARGLELGGWTLSAHHLYDPATRTLYLGSGERRTAQTLNRVVRTVAGTGVNCADDCTGFVGPATQTQLNRPRSVAVGPDGSLYILDLSNAWGAIRRVRPDGTISHFAGAIAGVASNADGIPATQALLYTAPAIAVGPDGSVYFTLPGWGMIRRITPDGIIRTIAGNGTQAISPDGSVAATSSLSSGIGALAVAAEGNVYFTEENRVRRIGTDGLLTTVAGNGQMCWANYPCQPDGPALEQTLMVDERGLTVDNAGNVYFLTGSSYLRRVGPDGILRTLVGLVQSWNTGTHYLTLGPDGLLYVAINIDQNPSVLRVRPDGSSVQLVAGGNPRGYGGDNGPATAASFSGSSGAFGGLAFGPDGTLYIGDYDNDRVRAVSPPLPGFGYDDILVPSEDGSVVYRFNAQGRHLQTLHALTGAALLNFEYDTAGRLVRVIDGDGNTTTIERDGTGVPLAVVAPFGQRTALALDAAGYLASVTNPAGEMETLSYVADGLLASVTGARGNRFEFSYDGNGRLAEARDPAGGTNELTRIEDALGYSVTQVTGLGRTDRYSEQNDEAGNRTLTDTHSDGTETSEVRTTSDTYTVRRPDGTTSVRQDAPDPRFAMQAPFSRTASLSLPSATNFWLSSATRDATLTNANDPFSLVRASNSVTLNGRTSVALYDAASRSATNLSPAGRISRNTIDVLGRVIFSQSANLNPVANVYDAHGRLALRVAGAGADARTNTFTYDTNSWLAATKDPLGRETQFTRDAAGRITKQTLPDGREVSFAYDPNGNRTSVTPPGRSAHTFTYTPVELAAQYTPPSVAATNETKYTHNADRQLTRVDRPDGRSLAYTYNGAAQLTRVQTGRGAYDHTYNTNGQLSHLTAPTGPALDFTYDGSLLTRVTWSGDPIGQVKFAYDPDLRVASYSVSGTDGGVVVVTNAYDADSLLTQVGGELLTHDPQNGLLTDTTLGLVTDTWTWNGFAESLSHEARANGAALFRQDLKRDVLGRAIQKTEVNSSSTNVFAYAYDLAGRLTNVTQNGAITSSYEYDANGNRLSVRRGADTETAAFDAQDRLLTRQSSLITADYSYTANGELLTKILNSATTGYAYDELGNLTHVTLPDGTVIDYLIDGRNRRVGRQVNGTITQRWLYLDGLRPAAELDASNVLVTVFAYATGANVPDYMIRGTNVWRLITDHLGSVRLVVNAADGEITQQLDYDEFGRVLSDTNPGFQPFGFAGGLYDPLTGLARFGVRDYDAEVGRWTSKDPVGFDGGDLNLYGYVANDPVNGVDPTGLGPGPTADVIGKIGDVTVQHAGGPPLPGQGQIPLYPGDILTTGPDSHVNIEFNKGGVVAVGPNTSVQLTGGRGDVQELGNPFMIQLGGIGARIARRVFHYHSPFPDPGAEQLGVRG